jgi:diguanylate cyclase (GGDEF)-like protein
MTSPPSSPRVSSVHRTYLAGVLVALGAFLLCPADSWLETGAFAAIGLSGAVAILVGIRHHAAGSAAPWRWFAVGVALNVTGTLVEAFVLRVLHHDAFPGVADVFYLGLYPAWLVGLVMIVRRRSGGTDWAALVDSTTISTGLGLLAWVFLIRPAAQDDSIGLLGHVVSVAYPIADVLVLAMVVRLLLGGGRASASYRLVAGSVLLLLANDATWSVLNQVGYEPGATLSHLLEVPPLLAYAAVGAAALHPSMRDVDERSGPRSPRLSLGLLALLTAASLIAPSLLAVEVAHSRVADGVAIVVGSFALFLLVVTRMAQLLRQVETQATELSRLARVDDLTGLPNRRAWTAELPRAMERARRDGQPLAVAMLDLDHFKRFNDDFGHPAGDRLLKEASAAWHEQLRAVDELARYGGEEFFVLLPGAGVEEATVVLERMRAVTPGDQSFSAGLVAWDGTETSEELVVRADRALYEAKAGGRDRIAVAA